MKKNKKTLKISVPAALKKVTAKQLHVLQLTAEDLTPELIAEAAGGTSLPGFIFLAADTEPHYTCLLYTSDAADE